MRAFGGMVTIRWHVANETGVDYYLNHERTDRVACDASIAFALERLGNGYADRLSPYRAGYTPAQRREGMRAYFDPDYLRMPGVAKVVPPKLLARRFRPLPVVWSVRVAPLPMVRTPEPWARLSFSWICTNVPEMVLAPPSCSVRPPSRWKPVEVNAAPGLRVELAFPEPAREPEGGTRCCRRLSSASATRSAGR